MNPVKFPYAKPVYGAAAAFLTAFVAARADGGVSGDEWLTIVLGTLIAGGAIVGVTGTEPKDGPVRKPVEPHGQMGYGAIELLVFVVVFVVVLVVVVWLLIALINHI